MHSFIIWHVFVLLTWLFRANSLLVELAYSNKRRSHGSAGRCFAASLDKGAETIRREETKMQLLDLIAGTPSNLPTSKSVTDQILDVVRQMEETCCPTTDEDVVEKLGGNWELLWTAQDQSSDEWGLRPLKTWIK
jgi:hypothetical protein